MSRAPILPLLLVVLAQTAWAFPDAVLRADHRPRFLEFVRAEGPAWGIVVEADGAVALERVSLETGKPGLERLRAEPTERLMEFVAAIPQGQTDAHTVRALRAFLSGREAKDAALEATLIEGAGLGQRLTALGRTFLIDIVTAEDGTLFRETLPFRFRHPRKGEGLLTKAPPKRAAKLPKLPRSLGEKDLGGLYDGSGAREDAILTAFDWKAMQGVKPLAAEPEYRGYAVDPFRRTLRVMVEADRAVATDRLAGPKSAADGKAALAEAGLDQKLFAAHGAKVVRAVDRLVTVEVPLAQAAKFGLALEDQGILSRPSRIFNSAAANALGGAPAAAKWLAPTTQFLPFPGPGAEAALLPGAVRDALKPRSPISVLNADARKMLGFEPLWKHGMAGKGAVIGIIDSGLDADHPDFKGRVAEYFDFTGEGNSDGLGHGTHVAGSAGGSGEASGGRYKGAAPDAKFVVFKVFNKHGGTTEDAILSAMKKAASLPPHLRPQVVNMSLGEASDPVTDPLAQMANRLMLKENILVVAAAGNSGPGNDTVMTPGGAQYVLTVTGVDKNGEFPFFSSRGPIRAGDQEYAKPDLSAVAGDLNLRAIKGDGMTASGGLLSAPAPVDGTCVYGPGGVVSPRSKDDPDASCTVQGEPGYRYMSGTSMAAPMAAGVAAGVIGYAQSKGRGVRATEVKAVLMETARDAGKPVEMQGAGLIDGGRLAAAVQERVQSGVPIGNIAYMLAVRLTSDQRKQLQQQDRFRMTPLGLVDTRSGRLIKSDKELFWMMKEIKGPMTVAFRKEQAYRRERA